MNGGGNGNNGGSLINNSINNNHLIIGKTSSHMLSQTTNPSSMNTPSIKNAASIVSQKYVGDEYLKGRLLV